MHKFLKASCPHDYVFVPTYTIVSPGVMGLSRDVPNYVPAKVLVYPLRRWAMSQAQQVCFD